VDKEQNRPAHIGPVLIARYLDSCLTTFPECGGPPRLWPARNLTPQHRHLLPPTAHLLDTRIPHSFVLGLAPPLAHLSSRALSRTERSLTANRQHPWQHAFRSARPALGTSWPPLDGSVEEDVISRSHLLPIIHNVSLTQQVNCPQPVLSGPSLAPASRGPPQPPPPSTPLPLDIRDCLRLSPNPRLQFRLHRKL
jgi:hypothetical protein